MPSLSPFSPFYEGEGEAGGHGLVAGRLSGGEGVYCSGLPAFFRVLPLSCHPPFLLAPLFAPRLAPLFPAPLARVQVSSSIFQAPNLASHPLAPRLPRTLDTRGAEAGVLTSSVAAQRERKDNKLRGQISSVHFGHGFAVEGGLAGGDAGSRRVEQAYVAADTTYHEVKPLVNLPATMTSIY